MDLSSALRFPLIVGENDGAPAGDHAATERTKARGQGGREGRLANGYSRTRTASVMAAYAVFHRPPLPAHAVRDVLWDDYEAQQLGSIGLREVRKHPAQVAKGR